MSIKCTTGETFSETVTSIIKTGNSAQYDSSGTYYYGSETKTFSGTVRFVEIISGNVYYSINGSSVTFSYSSSLSGATQNYKATVLYGAALTTVKDISNTNVDYINTSTDATKYVWTRPVDFQLQLPWDYIASWSLSRAGWGTGSTNSMCVDSFAGVLKSTDSSYTGTNTYTLPYDSYGIRYGDYLTLTLTPKVCILGDFAVSIGWFSEDVIFYMACVAIANFAQQSHELSYAFKFTRMIILTLVYFLRFPGFILGIILFCVFVATNTTVTGRRHYLYPLIPFDAKAMLRHVIRFKKQSRTD